MALAKRVINRDSLELEGNIAEQQQQQQTMSNCEATFAVFECEQELISNKKRDE